MSEKPIYIKANVSEPSFSSIGLGGWSSPIGIVQNFMEYLHISWGFPWWLAIAVCALFIQLLGFPLSLIFERNIVYMRNFITLVQLSGNPLEYPGFLQDYKVNILVCVIARLIQLPLFLSFLLGLRGMVNVPVESMREGGFFWFKDLTVSDYSLVLPLISEATMYLRITFCKKTNELFIQKRRTFKLFFQIFPIALFLMTISCTSAILMSWIFSNLFSLAQDLILENPDVRQYLNIEELAIDYEE